MISQSKKSEKLLRVNKKNIFRLEDLILSIPISRVLANKTDVVCLKRFSCTAYRTKGPVKPESELHRCLLRRDRRRIHQSPSASVLSSPVSWNIGISSPVVPLYMHPESRLALGGGAAVRAIERVARVMVNIPHVRAQATDAGEPFAAGGAQESIPVVMEVGEQCRWWCSGKRKRRRQRRLVRPLPPSCEQPERQLR